MIMIATMRNGHHSSLTAHPWMVGIIVVALIALVAVIMWLVHRRTVASDGLMVVERKTLGFPEREILSMLRQHGAAMRQNEIVDALPGDLEDVAEVVKNMETKGLIHRQWKSDEGTYIVSTQAEGMVNDNGR
jgi:uncharacterized membrane protein